MSENTGKENTVEEQEIEIPAEVEEIEAEFSTEGLLPEEVELAKEHGLIKDKEEKDGENEEQSESKTEEDTGTEEEKEEVEEKPSFEDVEKDESLTKKYNSNEKALYWKWKNDKKKRQRLEVELEEARSTELDKVKFLAAQKKIKRIADALGGEVTIEQLQSIINDESSEDKNAPLTRADLEAIEAEKNVESKKVENSQKAYKERLDSIDEYGKIKYSDFDNIVTLANQVVDGDETYKEILSSAFNNMELDEDKVVEKIVKIAKLSPDWGKKEEPKKDDNKDIDRVIKNSKKKVSSAAITSGGSGTAKVTESSLTVEQAAKLSPAQWGKLSKKTRDRILMGKNPS